ncbi:MAG: hypothetical protein ABI690_26560 [Chloroflexota bacterium]
MKNTIRNILVVVAVIVIAYFAITVVSNIVPILITAVAAFVLGRLSVHFDLLNFIRSARAAQVTRAAAAVTATAAAPVIANVAAKPAAPAPAQAEQAAERLADEPKVDKNILLDPNFEIKTPDQIEAEARLREQEVMKKASSASPDAVQAALEERRKRLLGGKE